MNEARKIQPAGDTPRKVADALNQHADLITTSLFQTKTIAELALLDATLEAGRSYYVPDEAGGPCLVVSNGTNWRRLTLGAIAS